jgi:hypothetical protein
MPMRRAPSRNAADPIRVDHYPRMLYFVFRIHSAKENAAVAGTRRAPRGTEFADALEAQVTMSVQ